MGYVDDCCGGYENLALYGGDLQAAYESQIPRDFDGEDSEEYTDSDCLDTGSEPGSGEEHEASDVEDYASYERVPGTASGSKLLVAVNDIVIENGGVSQWSFPRDDLAVGETSAESAARMVQKALRSKKYDRVFIDDELLMAGTFRRLVGKDLRRFFDQGGTIVIYAWMGYFNLADISRKLFGTSWQRGDYYRTTFSRTAAGSESFPAVDVGNFSAKCNMLKVPEADSMWASTANSMTASMVFASRPAEEGMTAVALHQAAGGGRLAYFGDVNWERDTCKLLRLMCQQRKQVESPTRHPMPRVLTPESLKAEGNQHFKQGAWESAIGTYEKALAMLLTDSAREQEVAKILAATLHANLAQCHLKQESYNAAAEAAGACLLLDPKHGKARYRRALALEKIATKEAAVVDLKILLRCEPGHKEALAALERMEPTTPKRAEHGQEFQSDSATKHVGKPRQAVNRSEPSTGASSAGAAGAVFFGHDAEKLNLSAWAHGLDVAKKHEWLVDCYRLRVDDDYCWGGCNLHGLYSPSATAAKIMQDFLVFCKMAVLRRVVPVCWDWPSFLKVASGLLPFAFEKSDAKEKWGGENVFSAMMGGRSLRYTGEVIYGTSIQAMDDVDEDVKKTQKHVRRQAPNELVANQFSKKAMLFQDVGGADAWFKLLQVLPQPQHAHGHEDDIDHYSDSTSDMEVCGNVSANGNAKTVKVANPLKPMADWCGDSGNKSAGKGKKSLQDNSRSIGQSSSNSNMDAAVHGPFPKGKGDKKSKGSKGGKSSIGKGRNQSGFEVKGKGKSKGKRQWSYSDRAHGASNSHLI